MIVPAVPLMSFAITWETLSTAFTLTPMTLCIQAEELVANGRYYAYGKHH